jgi:hypothetical protein
VWRGGGGTSAAKKESGTFIVLYTVQTKDFVNFYSKKSFNVPEQNEQKKDPVSARIFELSLTLKLDCSLEKYSKLLCTV